MCIGCGTASTAMVPSTRGASPEPTSTEDTVASVETAAVRPYDLLMHQKERQVKQPAKTSLLAGPAAEIRKATREHHMALPPAGSRGGPFTRRAVATGSLSWKSPLVTTINYLWRQHFRCGESIHIVHLRIWCCGLPGPVV